ncbi:hypothetical protein PBI_MALAGASYROSE_79 [Mycobacterium phage MalagasyRose]|uniref:Uncharacterized protein n=1 Tax=Mycobacterium phage MalagasyRose TaxID=2599870 RepID=A0A5J6TGF0_9CAUD|nr:hypothetical protein QEH39_gp09 [Mycobacterium phage MalagasyRose]QFG08927.1 hypothetical protein PBI_MALAGASYROSE_79 [Mycobacterium phage MalagasyRose]
MSDANGVIKQAAIDWFGADWRRAAGFGGYVLQQLQGSGYHVVGTGAIKPKPTAPYPPNTQCACGDLIHPDMPNVWAEADGVLWHGTEDNGGHRADVDPT